jgi:hypothetical protein
LVRSPATPDEDKMQNFKKPQNRTKFDFRFSWFARRPPRMKTKCKTSKSLKIVQSSFLGFLGSLAGHTPDEDNKQNVKKAQNRTKFDFRFSWFPRRPHPGSRKNAKRQKGSKTYKVRFWGFLDGSTATPDEDKMQNFKKAQNRTKFVLWVSWFARRPPRMKSKC